MALFFAWLRCYDPLSQQSRSSVTLEAVSDLLMFALSTLNTGPGIVVTYSLLIEGMREGAEVPD